MKKNKITKIAKDLGVSHSAVSQWFSATTLPKYKYMCAMNEQHNIPFTAWKDIKSYVKESITNEKNKQEVQTA